MKGVAELEEPPVAELEEPPVAELEEPPVAELEGQPVVRRFVAPSLIHHLIDNVTVIVDSAPSILSSASPPSPSPSPLVAPSSPRSDTLSASVNTPAFASAEQTHSPDVNGAQDGSAQPDVTAPDLTAQAIEEKEMALLQHVDDIIAPTAGDSISEPVVLSVPVHERLSDPEDLPAFEIAAPRAVPLDGLVSDAAPEPALTGEGWQANPGESAYDVLAQWSRDAGVDMVWESEFLVDVQEVVAIDGGYEDAVATLLEQYRDMRAGVQGTLYRDDRSGRRILLIETNG